MPGVLGFGRAIAALVLVQAGSGGAALTSNNSDTYSLSSDNTCVLAGTGSKNNVDPLLIGLGNYGGLKPNLVTAGGDRCGIRARLLTQSRQSRPDAGWMSYLPGAGLRFKPPVTFVALARLMKCTFFLPITTDCASVPDVTVNAVSTYRNRNLEPVQSRANRLSPACRMSR